MYLHGLNLLGDGIFDKLNNREVVQTAWDFIDHWDAEGLSVHR
jgi:hypothetical protein